MTREIEDEVWPQGDVVISLLVKRLDLVDEPFEVAFKELDGIDERTIGTELELRHDVLDGDKVSYVDVPVEVCTVICWVEVYQHVITLDSFKVQVESFSECGLTTPRCSQKHTSISGYSLH